MSSRTAWGGVRTVWLDNLKGIAIILMVLGHSGAPFTHWIFLFHMAVFYIAAGYTWNDKHVASCESLKHYIIRKIKTLYLPYFFCELLFLLLYNPFIELGIYPSSEEYLTLIGSNDESLLQSHIGATFFLKRLLMIIGTLGWADLAGATWFFVSLFIALCVYAILEYLLKTICKLNNRNATIFQSVIAVVFLLVAWMINENKFSAFIFNRLFAAYPLLVIGHYIKELNKRINWKPLGCILVTVISFAILYFMDDKGSISMARCKIENPLFFLIVSLAGWYLLESISRLIPKSFLAKLGESTRSIVMWHFASMKLVTLAYILIMELPIILLGAYPYLDNTTSWMWIVYTIVGVAIPYVLGILYDFLLKDSKYKI